MDIQRESAVDILYTNYRGETATRRIVPNEQGLRFGKNHWHTDQQWLLTAWDVDKQAYREFALSEIEKWVPVK